MSSARIPNLDGIEAGRGKKQAVGAERHASNGLGVAGSRLSKLFLTVTLKFPKCDRTRLRVDAGGGLQLLDLRHLHAGLGNQLLGHTFCG